jgi:cysteine-rich repeat protein
MTARDKRSGRWLLVAAMTVTGLVSAVPAAHAWRELTDPRVRWRMAPVSYHLDTSRVGREVDGPGVEVAETAAELAAQMWSAAGGEYGAEYAGRVDATTDPQERRNEIYWARSWDPALGDPTNVLAVAHSRSRGVGPVFTIVETDVVFNADLYTWTTGAPVPRGGREIGQTTVLHVMLHELGHSLGLGHSGATRSVMRARASLLEELGADDIEGALALYPPGAPLCEEHAQCVTSAGSSRCGEAGQCESIPPGAVGATCNGRNLQCDDGLQCLGFNGEDFRCTEPCERNEECGGGTFCALTTEGGVCWPPGEGAIGESCELDLDCQSAVCVSGVCELPCEADCGCPIGQSCFALGPEWHVDGYCVPGPSTCARCGDGEVQTGEQCDEGEANDDFTPDACRTSCQVAYCGDGVVDSDEACDDGNAEDGDRCSADCQLETEPPPDAGASDAGMGPDPDAGVVATPEGGPPPSNSGTIRGKGCATYAPRGASDGAWLVLLWIAFGLRTSRRRSSARL